MTRTVWIVAAMAAGTAAGALLLRQPSSSDVDMSVLGAQSVHVPDIQLPDVRVRREFVTVTIAAPPADPELASRRLTPGPSVSAAGSSKSGSSSARIASPQGGPLQPAETRVLYKVGRAVAGDGRYRPEPFPRVK